MLIFLLASTVNTFASEAYIHNERFGNCLIVNGVDASHFQDTSSNWEEARQSGLDFVILRATLTKTQSGDLENDSEFIEHYKNAKKAGFMCGVYAFSQARNGEEGKKEAEFILARLKELDITPSDLMLPVYMDYEFYKKENSRLSDLTSEDAIEAASAFCETIKNAGYDTGVYANISFFEKYLDNGSGLPEYADLWCAQYNETNDSLCDYSKWQYTSRGKVPGIYQYGTNDIPDDVDMNFWYIDKSMNEPEVQIYRSKDGSSLLLYDNDKKLKNGKDYITGEIRNSSEGTYLYIKGVGKYEGYAVVPVNEENEYSFLPAKIFSSGSYEIAEKGGRTSVGIVSTGTTAAGLLSELKLKKGNCKLKVTDSEGNILDGDDWVIETDMVGVFNEKGSVIGMMDIRMDTETCVNCLRLR